MASAWAVMALLTTIAAGRQAPPIPPSPRPWRAVPSGGGGRGLAGMSRAPMAGLKLDVSPRQAVRAVSVAGLLAMLGANLPGHLSYDSVAQLYEGHFHVRDTWGPALYAWVLGFFDRIIPGTALYVTVSGAILFGAMASLPDLRPRTR